MSKEQRNKQKLKLAKMMRWGPDIPHRCPVCGKYAIQFEFDICPVCGWESDSLQEDYPDYEGGANHMSLKQARAAYEHGEEVL